MLVPIDDDIWNFSPTEKNILDKMGLASALRSAGRGSAADLSGLRYEHLRVLLDDEWAWAKFAGFAEAFTNAEMPADIVAAFRLGRLTALRKKDKKVRGIVRGITP